MWSTGINLSYAVEGSYLAGQQLVFIIQFGVILVGRKHVLHKYEFVFILTYVTLQKENT